MSIRSFFNYFCYTLATGLGTGLIPRMPGTWGSLLACVGVYFYPLNLVEVILLIFLAWLIIYHYEKTTKTHDSARIVIDEIAGIAISFYAIPTTLPNLIAGFIIFRFLDIKKPLLIGWADRELPGAWGTLVDDLLAGFLTCIFLHLAVNWGWL